MKKWACYLLIFCGFIWITGCNSSSSPTLSDSSNKESSGVETGTVTEGGGSTGGAAEKVDTYEVQKGDTMWTIAKKAEVYGSGWMYPLLLKSNSDVVKNPNRLKAGMKLLVPRGQSATEIEAAKEEAMAADYTAPKAKPAAPAAAGLSSTSQAGIQAAGLGSAPATPEPSLAPTAAPAVQATSLRRNRGGGHTLLYSILLLLLVGAAAAYYYTRKSS